MQCQKRATQFISVKSLKIDIFRKKVFPRSWTKHKTQTHKVLCVDSTQPRKENLNSQNFAAFEFVIFFLAMRSGGYQKNAMKMHFFCPRHKSAMLARRIIFISK